MIEILRLNTAGELHLVAEVDTALTPISLSGNRLASSDDVTQTLIIDWTSGEYAFLEHLSPSGVVTHVSQFSLVNVSI